MKKTFLLCLGLCSILQAKYYDEEGWLSGGQNARRAFVKIFNSAGLSNGYGKEIFTFGGDEKNKDNAPLKINGFDIHFPGGGWSYPYAWFIDKNPNEHYLIFDINLCQNYINEECKAPVLTREYTHLIYTNDVETINSVKNNKDQAWYLAYGKALLNSDKGIDETRFFSPKNAYNQVYITEYVNTKNENDRNFVRIKSANKSSFVWTYNSNPNELYKNDLTINDNDKYFPILEVSRKYSNNYYSMLAKYKFKLAQNECKQEKMFRIQPLRIGVREGKKFTWLKTHKCIDDNNCKVNGIDFAPVQVNAGYKRKELSYEQKVSAMQPYKIDFFDDKSFGTKTYCYTNTDTGSEECTTGIKTNENQIFESGTRYFFDSIRNGGSDELVFYVIQAANPNGKDCTTDVQKVLSSAYNDENYSEEFGYTDSFKPSFQNTKAGNDIYTILENQSILLRLDFGIYNDIDPVQTHNKDKLESRSYIAFSLNNYEKFNSSNGEKNQIEFYDEKANLITPTTCTNSYGMSVDCDNLLLYPLQSGTFKIKNVKAAQEALRKFQISIANLDKNNNLTAIENKEELKHSEISIRPAKTNFNENDIANQEMQFINNNDINTKINRTILNSYIKPNKNNSNQFIVGNIFEHFVFQGVKYFIPVTSNANQTGNSQLADMLNLNNIFFYLNPIEPELAILDSTLQEYYKASKQDANNHCRAYDYPLTKEEANKSIEGKIACQTPSSFFKLKMQKLDTKINLSQNIHKDAQINAVIIDNIDNYSLRNKFSINSVKNNKVSIATDYTNYTEASVINNFTAEFPIDFSSSNIDVNNFLVLNCASAKNSNCRNDNLANLKGTTQINDKSIKFSIDINELNAPFVKVLKEYCNEFACYNFAQNDTEYKKTFGSNTYYKDNKTIVSDDDYKDSAYATLGVINNTYDSTRTNPKYTYPKDYFAFANLITYCSNGINKTKNTCNESGKSTKEFEMSVDTSKAAFNYNLNKTKLEALYHENKIPQKNVIKFIKPQIMINDQRMLVSTKQIYKCGAFETVANANEINIYSCDINLSYYDKAARKINIFVLENDASYSNPLCFQGDKKDIKANKTCYSLFGSTEKYFGFENTANPIKLNSDYGLDIKVNSFTDYKSDPLITISTKGSKSENSQYIKDTVHCFGGELNCDSSFTVQFVK